MLLSGTAVAAYNPLLLNSFAPEGADFANGMIKRPPLESVSAKS